MSHKLKQRFAEAFDTFLLGVERVGLCAQTAGSRALLLEVAAEGGGQERAEDKVGTPGFTVSLKFTTRSECRALT